VIVIYQFSQIGSVECYLKTKNDMLDT